MELAEYLNIMRKRLLSIILACLLGLAGGLGISLAATPIFTAQAQVFVSVSGAATMGEMVQGATFTVRAVRTYTQLVSSPLVLEPVINELGLTATASQLATQVSASSPLDTQLINVSANDPSPATAAAIANATAESLAIAVAQLETPVNGGPSPVQISTVRAAQVPSSPSSPNTMLNVALGLLIGLAAGIGLAILREVLNTKIRHVGDAAQALNIPVLGEVAYNALALEHPVILAEAPNSPRAEAFRRLRTNLEFTNVDSGRRALAVTSALPGEGKSSSAINLAITMAVAGHRVALIDGDLRRPSVAKYLGIEGSVGLSTVLIGQAELDDVIQPWGNDHLDIIAAGVSPPNPSELLGSQRMATVLDELLNRYDVVVFDTSPLLPVTDSAILAHLVGNALLVVGAGTIHRDQVRQAAATLESSGTRLLGMLVNRIPSKAVGGYSYTYYEYADPAANKFATANTNPERLSIAGNIWRAMKTKVDARNTPLPEAAQHGSWPEMSQVPPSLSEIDA
ncbi:MAG: polysaccharide biosynthesis tyrosine autokinase [Promicromonosporaceae bacterium]|nr:polysaccharide biosynthesis tyrosine autokinase [Promicromonosporaceae bacterium]